MGLYSTILASKSFLPPESAIHRIIPHDDLDFQTKDLNRDMQTYRLTKDGLLVKQFDLVEDGEWPEYKIGDSVFPASPKYKQANERWMPANYHGSLVFYDYYSPSGDLNDRTYYWFEFEAIFKNNSLQEVKIVNECLWANQKEQPIP